MKKIIVLSLSIFILAGCAKLAHLPELLTLKSLADNQGAQQKYAGEEDKRFAKLLEEIKAPDFKERFPDKESLREAFGEPIFSESVKKDNTTLEKWLYRYAAKLKDSEKVYLYFNESEKLVDFVHIK